MRERVIVALLTLAGLIHLLPLPGVLGARRLSVLYGIAIDSPVVVLLLRHRAVQLGLVGAWLLGAAWQPALRTAAVAAGLVSAASFLALARAHGEAGGAIRRVVVADGVAVASLVLAQALRLA